MGRVDTPADLNALVNEFGLKNYVETGFGNGTSMSIAEHLGLELWGIDLDEGFYNYVKGMSFGANAHLYQGYSKDMLPELLADMDDKPTLFWLDAHFPGADYGGAPYDAEADDTKRIPLEVELEIICLHRIIENDVFLMDDLRIYEDGPFGDGSWPLRATAGHDGCEFVEDILGYTHNIYRTYQDQGFLVCTPKSKDVSRYIRI